MKSVWQFPGLFIALAILGIGTTTAFAETIVIDDRAEAGALHVRSQGPGGVELDYRMASFAMTPVDVDGEALRIITLPGTLLPNEAGAPDLAGFGRFVAVPVGATARVEIVSASTRTFQNVKVAPAYVIPKDGDNGPLVYERDPAIYGHDVFYPASPVLISEPDVMRGVDVVRIGVRPFQYNPVSQALVVYTDLALRVTFEGGTDHFGEDRLRSRYWEPILRDHLINYASLPEINLNGPRAGRDGYEYVILTPDHPDFIAWGDSIKTWRKLQGISTAVFTTTDIGGTTATAIREWLEAAYTLWDVPPVAFLILGDYPGSGDGRDSGITSPIWDGYCVSDNMFADVSGNDLPDMAHGRICARDAGELEIMINKMFSYERNPYSDPDFYNHPIMAGGWQTERWFILCTEVCYGHQANVLGKDPVREYAIYQGTPGQLWSTNPNTEMVVDYFGPEGLGYIPATPEHLVDWGGNATRLNNDINDGAYMLMHRDHGGQTGWGEPSYGIGDLGGLHNELFPFVFSINCLTGKYNWAGECFTEAFHRMEHGALGLIAASEISYSFVNDTFVWGLFDGLWPEFDPAYGDAENTGDSVLRTAFAMAYGKYFLAASGWPSNPGSKVTTYHLFHHHGDAFMTIYSEVPQDLTVEHYESCPIGTESFTVQANEGSVIALTVDGEIIGVADATGDPQQIDIIPQTVSGSLRITVTKANFYRYDVTIPIGSGAFYVKADGTGDYPTIQAAIDASGESQLIELSDGIFTGPGNRDLDYHGLAITIRSRNANPEACIIDCEGGPGDPHRGFYFHSGEGVNSQLLGVTVTGGYAPSGGALECQDYGSPTIQNCIFEGNEAYSGDGGAIFADQSEPEISGCIFRGNTASSGGGFAGYYNVVPTLTECLFDNNSATESGGALYGFDAHAPVVTNCTFFGNAAPSGSGCAFEESAAATLDRCIITAGAGGAAISCAPLVAPAITCTDIYDNEGGDWTGLIAPLLGTAGNISADPFFCDPDAGSFKIHTSSPCAPENSQGCGQIGAYGIGCTPTFYALLPDGSGDFPTIQAALDAATFGDVIELWSGTYSGAGNRDLDFLGKRLITLRGRTGNPENVIIDCGGTAGDPHRGMVFNSGEEISLTVEAVTIVNGYATDDGGGVLIDDSSPTLIDCIIRNCTSERFGGGLAVMGNSLPALTRCSVTDNVASSVGGGVALISAAPTLTECTLANNICGTSGGGGLSVQAATPLITSCTFYGNTAPAGTGGGIQLELGASATVENTIISFSTEGVALGADGSGPVPTVICTDIFGNAGGDWVGVLAGLAGIDGNISEDPFFCDALYDDFSLTSTSLCAEENNPTCGQIGAFPVGCEPPFVVLPDGSGTYATIQAAIDAAPEGIFISLADGIFSGEGNRDINFRGKPITVRSLNGNPANCIIDCEGRAEEEHRGFDFTTAETSSAVLQGVTIINGYSTYGGAIKCSGSNPTIINCVFANCTGSFHGGGIYAYFYAGPTVIGCTFVGNSSLYGAGISCHSNVHASVQNCIFAHNTDGDAIHCYFNSSATASCCNVYDNEGGDYVSCLDGMLGVNGNISADPEFCDYAGGDYTLWVTSPCAPENAPPGCDLIGALPVGCEDLTGAPEERPRPSRLALAAPRPSTFRSTTTFEFAIPGDAIDRVHLSVYDLSGRLVRTLVNEDLSGGTYRASWDGAADHGVSVSSGVYYCRLTHHGVSRTRNVVLVR